MLRLIDGAFERAKGRSSPRESGFVDIVQARVRINGCERSIFAHWNAQPTFEMTHSDQADLAEDEI